ncbi:hypothetical protein EVAR_26425_1 [Eumeta japonica]|uniref:Uncharacterized protein n=1 Tax=Eumeta variegata TaxID=151549 RepID=A0A4C1VQ23_EUMVA|nr:hypothetical protein EVAR_26425_1 [Eumeta japonica]
MDERTPRPYVMSISAYRGARDGRPSTCLRHGSGNDRGLVYQGSVPKACQRDPITKLTLSVCPTINGLVWFEAYCIIALWWCLEPGRKPRASGERELHNSVYREFRFHNEMTQL